MNDLWLARHVDGLVDRSPHWVEFDLATVSRSGCIAKSDLLAVRPGSLHSASR